MNTGFYPRVRNRRRVRPSPTLRLQFLFQPLNARAEPLHERFQSEYRVINTFAVVHEWIPFHRR